MSSSEERLSYVLVTGERRIPDLSVTAYSHNEFVITKSGSEIRLVRKARPDDAPYFLTTGNCITWRPYIPELHDPPDPDGNRPKKK